MDIISRRQVLAGAAALATGALAGVGPSPARAASLVLPDPPADGIPRGQIFDNQIQDRSVYAGLVSFVWGASSLTQPAGAVPSGYLPAFRDFDRTHTLAWYQANHPDWVVYQADRVTPAWEFGNTLYVPVDFTNPAVRTHYFTTFVEPLIAQGYPVIGFDNVATPNVYNSAGHFDAGGAWVQQYSGRDDRAWPAAVIDWLRYLAAQLHARGVGIAANITWNASVVLSDIQQAVDAVDVYVDEQGFTVHRDANYTDDAWRAKYDFARSIAQDKLYLAINQTTTADLADASQAQVDWAIANYLLYRERRSMMTLCGVGQYHVFVDRPELHTNLGTPASTPVLDSTGGWKRSYTGGRVLVNPSSSQAVTMVLPAGTWTDLHGTTYSGHITLPPNSGSVLSN
ncbi:MAG: hypothetical protein HOY71_35605 [Nonomuraea sp.]|nr:hypothetical protein [Nonomuraea sp.]